MNKLPVPYVDKTPAIQAAKNTEVGFLRKRAVPALSILFSAAVVVAGLAAIAPHLTNGHGAGDHAAPADKTAPVMIAERPLSDVLNLVSATDSGAAPSASYPFIMRIGSMEDVGDGHLQYGEPQSNVSEYAFALTDDKTHYSAAGASYNQARLKAIEEAQKAGTSLQWALASEWNGITRLDLGNTAGDNAKHEVLGFFKVAGNHTEDLAVFINKGFADAEDCLKHGRELAEKLSLEVGASCKGHYTVGETTYTAGAEREYKTFQPALRQIGG